jgi:hypothetical protein
MLRCVVGYLKSFMSRYRTAHSPGSTARTRHAALSEKKAPEKAAQIRALWPEIKMALDTGHSHESVCECLAADGINVSARSLASYISRIRRTSPADRDRAPSIRADSAVPPLAEEKPKRNSSQECNPKPSKSPHSALLFRGLLGTHVSTNDATSSGLRDAFPESSRGSNVMAVPRNGTERVCDLSSSLHDRSLV